MPVKLINRNLENSKKITRQLFESLLQNQGAGIVIHVVLLKIVYSQVNDVSRPCYIKFVIQVVTCTCIVGNKIDQINRREIPSYIGEQFAKRYEMKFIETSAKEAENVDALFYDIATELTKLAHQQALETDKGVNFNAHNTSTISSCSTCLRF